MYADQGRARSIRRRSSDEMAEQIKGINRSSSPTQVVEIDEAAATPILDEARAGDRSTSPSSTANIEKEHVKVHQIADRPQEGDEGSEPVPSRSTRRLKAKPAEYKAQVRTLYDECKSLSDSHGGTVLGVKLTGDPDRAQEVHGGEQSGLVGAEHRPAPGRGPVHGEEGRVLAQASAKINEFGEKFKEKDKLELINKLNEQREFLDRASRRPSSAEKVTKGQKEIAEATLKKEDFKKRLEGYQAGLEGLQGSPRKARSVDSGDQIGASR